MNICDFCSKIFRTKYILRNHIKMTKKCLKIQASQASQASQVFRCLCGKICTSKYNLNKHISTCKKLTNIELEDIKLLLVEKNKEIHNLSDRLNMITTSKHTNINHTLIDIILRRNTSISKDTLLILFDFKYQYDIKLLNISSIDICHEITKYYNNDDVSLVLIDVFVQDIKTKINNMYNYLVQKYNNISNFLFINITSKIENTDLTNELEHIKFLIDSVNDLNITIGTLNF